MSTVLLQQIGTDLIEQYEAVRERIEAGASQRAACEAVGLHRSSFHRIARSLESGATTVDWAPSSLRDLRVRNGKKGMASRWAGHTAVSTGSPETYRAYHRAYRRRRIAADPVYALYARLKSRFYYRKHEWLALGVLAPRMRGKRLVLSTRTLPLLTPEEHRALFPSTAAGASR